MKWPWPGKGPSTPPAAPSQPVPQRPDQAVVDAVVKLRQTFAGKPLGAVLDIMSSPALDQLAMMQKLSREPVPWQESPAYALYVLSWLTLVALRMGHPNNTHTAGVIAAHVSKVVAMFGGTLPDPLLLWADTSQRNPMLVSQVDRHASDDFDEAMRGGIPLGLMKIRTTLKGPIRSA